MLNSLHAEYLEKCTGLPPYLLEKQGESLEDFNDVLDMVGRGWVGII